MRVHVYVDGFNLYYRALKKTNYKWLDLEKLAHRLLQPTDEIGLIRYFTARVSPRAGNLTAPRDQQIYLSALSTLDKVQIQYGRFMTKTKRRPLADNPTQFAEFLDTEEKGSDVNLAVHLLHDGWRNAYDVALVLSQDTDLIEPMRMVREELGKTLGLVWLDGRRPNPDLEQVVSFVRHIAPSDLAASQFPDRFTRPAGGVLTKPAGW